ncbi:hypothetical protein ACQ4PT_040754 [Festuca glaucescens]
MYRRSGYARLQQEVHEHFSSELEEEVEVPPAPLHRRGRGAPTGSRVGRIDMASVEDDLVDDPAVRFKMRFSVRRFEVAMRTLTPKQIGFLVKYGYDLILELKHKVVFPMVLIDWVMDNMVPELAMFRYEHKRIYFDKYMIQQFIGIPSGDTIAKMSSKDPVIVDKVVYMDFLELNPRSIQYSIDYGVPRIFHVNNADFKLVTQFDRIHSSGIFVFGAIDFREKSCTPYSNHEFKEFLEKQSKRQHLVLSLIGYGSNLPSSSQENMNSDPFNSYSNNLGNIPMDLQKIVGSIIKSHKEKIVGDVTNLLERSFDLMSTEIFSTISEHYQPPPAETPFQPPPAEMHYQPPSTETHSQPPTSETHFQPPTGYAVNKCTDLVEHTFVGDAKVGASFANDVDNYEGTTSNIVSSPRQEHAASDHDHFMDQHENTVVKSSHCNEHVIEQNKAPTNSNVTGDKRNCDAGTSSPQEDFPYDLVMKTHNEPILDKDKSKSDISATRDSVIKANTLLDDASASTPQEDFPSDLVIKAHHEPILDKDKLKSDTSATRDSVIKAKTLLDDASASPKHVQFKDSGLSITDVVYISSQEQEVDHSVENVARQFDGVCISTSQQEYYVAIEQEHIAQHSKCIDAIGDVASAPPSSSPKGEAHSDTIKSAAKDCDETDVNRGIDIAMSYASEDPQSPFSNAHTPLCTSSAEVQSDDVSNTGPSTIDKRKQKKRNAKKPCHSKERLNLIVVDLNGHAVTYERFYQSLKARGEIANEVMDAFVQLFNERNDKVKDDKSSLRKISFSPFFTSKLNVPPEKFNAKSVNREIVKMNKKFNFAKCDLLHFPLVHDHHWTITSINLLLKKINFLDSLQDNNKEKKAIMASNMVTNFHKACTESKCFNFMLDNYVPEIPHNLPQQTTTFDCGVFSFLYMEHWEGQEFKMFEHALISKVRKVVAHGLVSSTMNDMTTKVNNFKKQRLS